MAIHKLNDRSLLLISGKQRIQIKVISIDPINHWSLLDVRKIGVYNSELCDLQSQSETQFLALTKKGLLQFNTLYENVEKIVRFKDPSTAMI